MNKLTLLLIFFILSVSVAVSGCSSGKGIGGTSKRCGCGMNKGMVGY
jgi:predicted small secreted protein